MNINVKITGSGTPKEVIKSLEAIVKTVKAANQMYQAQENPENAIFKLNLEDPTLMTEISED